MNRFFHKTCFSLGTTLWILCVILERKLFSSLAYNLLYGSGALMLFGIIGWFIGKPKRKSEVNDEPKLLKTSNKFLARLDLETDLAIYEFIISNFRTFVISIVIIWMALTFLGSSSIKSTKSFSIISEYIYADKKLEEEIGEVKGFGFIIEKSHDRQLNEILYFNVIGTAKSMAVRAEITREKEIVAVSYSN